MDRKDSAKNIQIDTNLPYNKAKRKKMLTDAQMSAKNYVEANAYENIN